MDRLFLMIQLSAMTEDKAPYQQKSSATPPFSQEQHSAGLLRGVVQAIQPARLLIQRIHPAIG
ncbi:hypothetical protein [Sphingobium cupriresistens]|nr:hypothetical protein [Sphingobium cupriresistens]